MRRRDFITRLSATTAASAFAAAAPAAEQKHAALRGDSVAEPSRDVPVTHRADVVVAGATTGGLGGCMAALAAARGGAKTILIEEAGHIDPHIPLGLGVVLGIRGWLPTIREGLFRELAERVAASGQSARTVMSAKDLLDRGGITLRYHDVFTTALLAMLQEAGVQLLFHTQPTGTAVEDGTIRAIVVESPLGRHAIAGKQFVDSTGLADLAAFAGAPLLREEGTLGLQAYISGVDTDRYQKWLKENNAPLDDSYRRWLDEQVGGPIEKLKHPWEKWFKLYLGGRIPWAVLQRMREAHAKKDFTLLYRYGKEGIMAVAEGIKASGGVALPRSYITGIDPLKVDDLNWAEVQSRILLLNFQRFLQKYVPGFEKSVLERLADSVSIRGGRYIAIARNPTTAEINGGAKNPDCIFLLQRGERKGVYQFPFRALVPERVKNLLVVGKSTAGGMTVRAAHAILFQGQAAGTAAAMTAATGRPMAEVDIRELQKRLKATGVVIPG